MKDHLCWKTTLHMKKCHYIVQAYEQEVVLVNLKMNSKFSSPYILDLMTLNLLSIPFYVLKLLWVHTKDIQYLKYRHCDERRALF